MFSSDSAHPFFYQKYFVCRERGESHPFPFLPSLAHFKFARQIGSAGYSNNANAFSLFHELKRLLVWLVMYRCWTLSSASHSRMSTDGSPHSSTSPTSKQCWERSSLLRRWLNLMVGNFCKRMLWYNLAVGLTDLVLITFLVFLYRQQKRNNFIVLKKILMVKLH